MIALWREKWKNNESFFKKIFLFFREIGFLMENFYDEENCAFSCKI
jgi:hypothetical protein